MKVQGIIPARYSSSRLPGKPLVDISGKSLIQRVYERSIAVLENVVVATDDQRIFDHVLDFGGEAAMTERGHQTGTNRCLEAYSRINSEAEIIINIQGDEPLLETSHIRTIIDCFKDDDVRMASLALKLDGQASINTAEGVYVVLNKNNDALYFSRSVIPFIRDAEPKDWTGKHQFYRHIGMYAFRPEALAEFASLPQSSLEKAESLEQNRWLENGGSIRMGITDIPVIAVDTPADLEKVRARFQKDVRG